jgi:hypothetical protein
MPHAIPLGTRLLLTLPFTPELLDGDEYEPFCPGITGTVECWVIGHDPLDPDPEYTICPHKARKLGGQPMWDFLADVDAMQGTDLWLRYAMLELTVHRVERRIPERLLLPFVQKD